MRLCAPVRYARFMSVKVHGSDEARALHAEAPPVDLHADPLLWAKMVGYDLTRRHRPPLPLAWFGGHVDVPRMLDGGMGAQFFGLVSLPHLERDLEDSCHRQIDLLNEAIDRSEGRLQLARTAEQVQAATEQGGVAALLGIEGAHALHGRIKALDEFAARGVRYLGLLHFTANECGAPAFGQGADPAQGLSPFGQDVVERAEELGVIVDLAHMNKKGVMDVCEMARRPPIVSHTGLAGVEPLWRNIDDEQLRAIAEQGGVAGVIFCPRYLGRDGIERVVDHLMHIVDVAGEEVPALGSDWDGFIRPTRGLEEPSKLPALTDALLARGLSRGAVRKLLRDNALRILREIPPAL
jgi:membrane dipeptidase